VSLPLVTVEQSSGRAIGGTRCRNIDVSNRGVEIASTWTGSTWIDRACQRTSINSGAMHLPESHRFKYLVIRHAFEQWLRVELKADASNQKSRNVIPAHRS
jgi:RimJ/RimL family protein N-acetyltransferase